jgi:hypothetical protein
MSHTPGPWFVVAPDNHPFQIVRPLTQISETIAQVYESEADARLIAAAPDLLTALEALIADSAPDREGSPAHIAARAALAKAQP